MPGGQALMGVVPARHRTNACYMEEARHVAVLDEDRAASASASSGAPSVTRGPWAQCRPSLTAPWTMSH